MEAITEVSRKRIELLYPSLRPLAFRVCQDVFTRTGRIINIADSYRSMDDQWACYKKGRQLVDDKWVITCPGKVVTNARPGLSWHCYGLAFDSSWQGEDPYLLKEKQNTRAELWSVYGQVGKSYGMKWGGDFHLVNGVNDLPHLEMSYGLTIEQCRELYETGDTKAIWMYLDKLRGVT